MPGTTLALRRCRRRSPTAGRAAAHADDERRRSIPPHADEALARSRVNASREEDDINRFVTELTEATSHLADHGGRGHVVLNNIEDLLQHGVSIDRFMQRHPLTKRAQSDWLTVRRDLDDVARAHNVAWDWKKPPQAAARGPADFNDRLSGTHQLDSSRARRESSRQRQRPARAPR